MLPTYKPTASLNSAHIALVLFTVGMTNFAPVTAATATAATTASAAVARSGEFRRARSVGSVSSQQFLMMFGGHRS